MNTHSHTNASTPGLFMVPALRTVGSRLALCAGLALCLHAAAQPAAFDEASGTRATSYPPHRIVDFKHMRLDITIADMNTPVARVQQTLTFTPIRGGLTTLSLDAKGLKIGTVESSGGSGQSPVEFQHDGRQLRMTFDPALPEGKEASLTINYTIEDPKLGLVWTPESPEWPGRAAQLHTQGQPQTNSYWFPCHDFPNERLTTELIVTAPAGYEVSSNGTLVERTRKILTADDAGGGHSLQAHERWRFLQDKPHVNYLVSLVVGRFDIVDVASKGQVPMPVYVPPGRGGDVAGTYGRTPRMVELFGQLLDEPYPWNKYAQLVVWNFGAGGMENTSATTMYDTAIMFKEDQEDHDLDGLISHELGHQWFGDLITCNSWEHIWLNEGFATYMTSLWMEHRDGLVGYQQSIRGSMDGTAGNDKPAAPSQVGMVSKVYTHPWETFRRPANPYSKGCSILHMLRMKLGDGVFFAGLRRYVNEHKFTTVETSDFRRTLELESGESLEQFFAQWCYRPGVPAFTVTPTWDEQAKSLTIALTQNQQIDGDNPAFEFELPMVVHHASSNERQTLKVSGRTATITLPCEVRPGFIEIDPYMTVLGDMTVVQDEGSFLEQLRSGTTPASRIAALRGLRTAASSRSFEAIRRTATDDGQPTWIRTEAVRTLGACKSVSDLRALATTSIKAWEVREAITSELAVLAGPGSAGSDHIARLLIDRATKDTSLKVRCAAIRGLGNAKSVEGLPTVLDALTRESQSDGLRQASLEALGAYDLAEYLPKVLACTRDGFDSRTRPIAIGVAARLSHHDPDAVFEAITPLLTDRQLRTARAAGEALVQMKHPKAAEAIVAALGTEKAEEIAWQAGQWLKALRAK